MLIAIICAVLTFFFPIYTGNVVVGANGHVFMEVKAMPVFGFGKESASSGSTLILIVTAIIIVGALINIFNYKTRRKQIWLTIGLIVLSLLNLFLYWQASGAPHFVEGRASVGVILPIVIPIFLFMAVRGILKDEKLVKSADRLR